MGAACSSSPGRGGPVAAEGGGRARGTANGKEAVHPHRRKPTPSRRLAPVTEVPPPVHNLTAHVSPSNQDMVSIQRIGKVSTISHKLEPAQSEDLSACENGSRGAELISETNAKKENMNASALPIIDDDVFCPTCLEGYDEENPKMITKCNHHYHLSCILEWKERKDSCPICNRKMDYDEEI